MQGNDIAEYSSTSQGVVFEGLLASPPSGARSLFANFQGRRGEWDEVIKHWRPHELPLKALADCVNRLGIGTDVYTFLHPDAADAIDSWLVRKGISVPVYYYEGPQFLEYDLRFNRAIKFVYTSDEEVAKVLGVRATVTSPDRAWTP